MMEKLGFTDTHQRKQPILKSESSIRNSQFSVKMEYYQQLETESELYGNYDSLKLMVVKLYLKDLLKILYIKIFALLNALLYFTLNYLYSLFVKSTLLIFKCPLIRSFNTICPYCFRFFAKILIKSDQLSH